MQDYENINIGSLMEPATIPFTFDAPAWSVLWICLFVTAISLILRLIKQYKKRQYRREAVRQIENIFQGGFTEDQMIFRLALILKQVSVLSYGREQVGMLDGHQWFDFLSKRNHQQPVFEPTSQSVFIEQLYKGKHTNIDQQTLLDFKKSAIKWIKNHHV
ncbi:DUF4381 domain-containing protein [Persicobacter psychrovividus]|uniref:DUF4381 domain-containing protein n=1 Tax=Persicobacter psychrovividus TaxID=387638 RepID=A0ABM7VN10_9BACT|nr:hypothetical protein PEPS_46770 [Persicobacter psychrovividus]